MTHVRFKLSLALVCLSTLGCGLLGGGGGGSCPNMNTAVGPSPISGGISGAGGLAPSSLTSTSAVGAISGATSGLPGGTATSGINGGTNGGIAGAIGGAAAGAAAGGTSGGTSLSLTDSGAVLSLSDPGQDFNLAGPQFYFYVAPVSPAKPEYSSDRIYGFY